MICDIMLCVWHGNYPCLESTATPSKRYSAINTKVEDRSPGQKAGIGEKTISLISANRTMIKHLSVYHQNDGRVQMGGKVKGSRARTLYRGCPQKDSSTPYGLQGILKCSFFKVPPSAAHYKVNLSKKGPSNDP